MGMIFLGTKKKYVYILQRDYLCSNQVKKIVVYRDKPRFFWRRVGQKEAVQNVKLFLKRALDKFFAPFSGGKEN